MAAGLTRVLKQAPIGSLRWVLAVGLLLIGGCGHDCSAMGCVQGVTLELASPLTEPGEYSFEITTDTVAATCKAFVPLRRDGTEPTCEEMLINRSEVTTQSDNAVTGTAGDDIVSVWLGGDHETITFLVTRDGAAVLEADITPRYRGVEINGAGCGECPMATHTLSE